MNNPDCIKCKRNITGAYFHHVAGVQLCRRCFDDIYPEFFKEMPRGFGVAYVGRHDTEEYLDYILLKDTIDLFAEEKEINRRKKTSTTNNRQGM